MLALVLAGTLYLPTIPMQPCSTDGDCEAKAAVYGCTLNQTTQQFECNARKYRKAIRKAG
jgi:hypothetical protein